MKWLPDCGVGLLALGGGGWEVKGGSFGANLEHTHTLGEQQQKAEGRRTFFHAFKAHPDFQLALFPQR
jgi:hypothetical protein